MSPVVSGWAEFADKHRTALTMYSAKRTVLALLHKKKISTSRMAKACNLWHRFLKMVTAIPGKTRRHTKKKLCVLHVLHKVTMIYDICCLTMNQVIVRLPFLWVMLPYIMKGIKEADPTSTGSNLDPVLLDSSDEEEEGVN